MKVILTAIAMLIAGPASAADMPTKGPTAATNAYAAAAPMFAGFYVGGHVGYAWLDADPFGIKANGVNYGGHFGVNYQKGPVVVGIEAALTSYDRATKFGNSTTGCDCFVGDLKGKLGFTPTANTLIYATAGAFWHNAGVPANLVPAFGWLAGGGVSWLPFNDHIMLSLEAIYRSLGNDTSFVTVTGWDVTGRLAYKF